MKSAFSAGLVAALLCPTTIIAGPTCPKTARGSNRVTCFVKVNHTDIGKQDNSHDKRGHKDKVEETTRTFNIYSWSFLWNYVIKDDCPKTTAHLSSLVPLLGPNHHGVKCRVEIGWSPGHADGKQHRNAPGYYNNAIDPYHIGPGNQSSWDYAGHGQIDYLSLPAKMEWPLCASFDRPDELAKSGQLGAKYESAAADATNTFEIRAGHGNDFFLSWGHDAHTGKPGFGEYQENEGSNDKNDKNDKKDKKGSKKEKETRTSVSSHHGKIQGHYNTKNLYSCWVFEKRLHAVRQVTSEKKKKGQKGKDDMDANKNNTEPLIPFHPHPPSWSTCEPRIPVPFDCEEECHGDSCGHKHNECKGNACSSDHCHGTSCGRKHEVSKALDDHASGQDHKAGGEESGSDSDDNSDDGSDDDSGSDDDCDDGSCDGGDKHGCNC
ncbi:hypothetical protein C7999DRAFT_27324 [Corynascus novoguineensis]|uniref:Uncharacterized protein n=1 Tax=Corynascus novoguineensis TaxID=1126955 RepID=A0AAN7D4V3_9PEZI|nr:hypothetical protein C7999DRAFT_27324 [Corynascus novoguineensis]